VLVILVCAAILLGLLWAPVLGDRFTGFLSRTAPRVAPRIFFLGLGIAVIGLVTGARILDLVGACLIGGVMLGVILDNY
jgi:type III secretory pathway component EscT